MGAFAMVLAVTAFVPAMASAQGNLVDDLLKGLLGGGGNGDGAATPNAGVPPNYTPPLHGTDPHGQGTVGVVDLTPSNTAPLPGTPGAADEDVVIGDADGGQENGAYHGRVSLLHLNVLGLINESVLPVETVPGETKNGPLQPLQDAVDDICTNPALAQAAGCIELLPISSSTSNSGSQNTFGIAGTDLDVAGVAGLDTGIAQSSGSISETGGCQTSNGSSNVANANIGVTGVPGGISADALGASSTSTACSDGSTSQTNSSNVVDLQALNLPVGSVVPIPAGCQDGTPNTETGLAPLLGILCNATDSNGGQNNAPYGVREALTVFALALAGNPLAKATLAGPESHAVAPTTPGGPGPEDPTAGGPGGPGENGNGNPGGPGDGDDEPGGPATTTAQPGDGELAFTGANLAVLALMGGSLVLGGIAIATSSARHRRAAA